MDRRRFVPSTEGMEGRTLLSLFGAPSKLTSTLQTDANLPQTFKAKLERIDHLPYYLQQVDRKAHLPADALGRLQSDLVDIAGRLHAPDHHVVETFNLGLRSAYPHRTLSKLDAARLNRAFGVVLATAGATDSQVANLKRDMNDLARAASASDQPVILASNEYAIVLQIGLAVGRPIQTPAAPKLAPKQGTDLHNGLAGRTPLHSPVFSGTYLVGKTPDSSTHIEIFDANGVLIARGAVNKLGDYHATTIAPLEDAIYKLQARAVDAQGHQSNLSPVYTLRVFTLPGGRVH